MAVWKVLMLVAAGIAGVMYWMRTHPDALPYSLRVFVQTPHPIITRRRLREILDPRPGERILEVGPGTGYYTADIAEWVGSEGRVDIFDIQQEFLDHAMRAASARGVSNVTARRGDAQSLPYEDESFDAAVLTTVLGEIPDQDAALREHRRVLKPGGRLIVGELVLGDPHYVNFGSLRPRAEAAGLRFERRSGGFLGYFARLERP